jgi:hypothetical protein
MDNIVMRHEFDIMQIIVMWTVGLGAAFAACLIVSGCVSWLPVCAIAGWCIRPRFARRVVVAVTPAVLEAATPSCASCATHDADTMLRPCGHTRFCSACARRLLEKKEKCPICEQAVSAVAAAYL